MYDWYQIFAIILLGIPLVLLVIGLGATSLWMSRGGLAQNLARVLMDPGKARRFVFLFATVAASLLAVGALFALEIIVQSSNETFLIAISAVFLVGCLGLFLLMVNGLPTGELRLEDELRLRTSYPAAAEFVETSQSAGTKRKPESMYVLPPLTTSGPSAGRL
jgi:flagellar basal body-associated protein FliL